MHFDGQSPTLQIDDSGPGIPPEERGRVFDRFYRRADAEEAGSGLGLAIGLVAAYFTAELLAGNLYGVSPHDPPTFAFVPLLLASVALLACYLPARRATKISPITALRTE